MNTLAQLSGSNLLNQLLVLLVVGVVIGIVLWLIGKTPMPAPFQQVITWLCYVVAAIILINFLLGLIGRSFITF